MAKGGRGGRRSSAGMITAGEKDLDFSKVGASFSKLPKNFQEHINNNLKISKEMKEDIKNGRKNKMTSEWTTGLSKSKDKIKVITDVKDGKLVYTVKKKQKVLQKNVSKERAANSVAKFYLDVLKS